MTRPITAESMQELRDKLAALLDEYLPGQHLSTQVSVHNAEPEVFASFAALPGVSVDVATNDGVEEYDRAVPWGADLQMIAYGKHRRIPAPSLESRDGLERQRARDQQLGVAIAATYDGDKEPPRSPQVDPYDDASVRFSLLELE